MKNLIVVLLILFGSAEVLAQITQWNTLRTDDGEFSIKMPVGCESQFYNKDGIEIYNPINREYHKFKEMRVVSCYEGKTLMNVETYETNNSKSVVRLLADSRFKSEELPLEKFFGIEQINHNERFSLIRRIFAGRRHIYIVTTATRVGETSEIMQSFLQSVRLGEAEDNAEMVGDGKIQLFSALKSVIPETVLEGEGKQAGNVPPLNSTLKTTDDPTLRKALPVHLPSGGYTIAARKNNVRGSVKFRLTLGADATVKRIEVIKSLPDGLMRGAVLAVMRTKFLPAEQKGEPQTVSQIIEYGY